jgi:DNA-binding protein HU-beta
MTKPELIASLALKVNITKADAERAFDHIIQVIAGEIKKDGRVEIGGFGVFKVKESAEVTRPNPQNRAQMITTPKRNTVKFRPSPALKALVN